MLVFECQNGGNEMKAFVGVFFRIKRAFTEIRFLGYICVKWPRKTSIYLLIYDAYVL